MSPSFTAKKATKKNFSSKYLNIVESSTRYIMLVGSTSMVRDKCAYFQGVHTSHVLNSKKTGKRRKVRWKIRKNL